MRAELFNILALIIWLLIGYVNPSIHLMFTFFFYPLVFALSLALPHYDFSNYILIPFYFIAILIDNYVFKIYLGHTDQVGKDLFELAFYITLCASTVVLLFVSYSIQKQNTTNGINSIELIKNISYVIFCSAISLLIFKKS